MNVSVPICFKLHTFFKHLDVCEQQFDSDSDFTSVGDEDEVVGKIQNDELSTVQKCFIFLLKIGKLKV